MYLQAMVIFINQIYFHSLNYNAKSALRWYIRSKIHAEHNPTVYSETNISFINKKAYSNQYISTSNSVIMI